MRRLLRQKYGIAGRCARAVAACSPPPRRTPAHAPRRARAARLDFPCHAFCTCCSLAREAREIQSQTLADVLRVEMREFDAEMEVV